MFKDAEKGDKEVNIERTEQALDTKPEIIAADVASSNAAVIMPPWTDPIGLEHSSLNSQEKIISSSVDST